MNFQLLRPRTVGEALVFLSRFGPQARVMAGGTDLLVKAKRKLLFPSQVIDITAIDGFDSLKIDKNGTLLIGAAVTHNQVIVNKTIAEKYTALKEASSQLGSLQVRNLATVVGNICNASPSAETASALLVLGAKVVINNCQGLRVISLEDFFIGPGKTILVDGDIVTEVQIQEYFTNTGSAYIKLSPRRAMDTAIVGVSALVRIKPESDRCLECRIALGAVGPTPMRAYNAEDVLVGENLSNALLVKAGAQAAEASRPIDDLRASAEYRKKMVAVLTRRALEIAWERAKEVVK